MALVYALVRDLRVSGYRYERSSVVGWGGWLLFVHRMREGAGAYEGRWEGRKARMARGRVRRRCAKLLHLLPSFEARCGVARRGALRLRACVRAVVRSISLSVQALILHRHAEVCPTAYVVTQYNTIVTAKPIQYIVQCTMRSSIHSGCTIEHCTHLTRASHPQSYSHGCAAHTSLQRRRQKRSRK